MTIRVNRRSYINVMELLVLQEVEHQIKKLPAKLSAHVKPMEVATFALNQLKPLYASSPKGVEHQRERALQDHGDQIVTAVRQGIAAVQRDMLRKTAPLNLDEEGSAQAALDKLKRLLQRDDLNWTNVADVIERSLHDASTGEQVWAKPEPQATAQQFDFRTGRMRFGS
jgi:Late competence development protein ComFB